MNICDSEHLLQFINNKIKNNDNESIDDKNLYFLTLKVFIKNILKKLLKKKYKYLMKMNAMNYNSLIKISNLVKFSNKL